MVACSNASGESGFTGFPYIVLYMPRLRCMQPEADQQALLGPTETFTIREMNGRSTTCRTDGIDMRGGVAAAASLFSHKIRRRAVKQPEATRRK